MRTPRDRGRVEHTAGLINGTVDYPHAWSPEQRLWGAVLADAFECLQRLDSRHVRARQRARAALSWVLSAAGGFGTFEHTCAALGLDADAVRARVIRRQVARVTRYERSGAAIASG